jgi:hypothetical protein
VAIVVLLWLSAGQAGVAPVAAVALIAVPALAVIGATAPSRIVFAASRIATTMLW